MNLRNIILFYDYLNIKLILILINVLKTIISINYIFHQYLSCSTN